MKKRDRKGSDWSQYKMVETPKLGARVLVDGYGMGTVTDVGIVTHEVRFDDGRVLRVNYEAIFIMGDS